MGWFKRRRGATAVQYGLLVGLIALASLAALAAVGVNLAAVFSRANTQISVGAGATDAVTLELAGMSADADPVVTLALRFTRVSEATGPVSVTVATADGSAHAGSDYTALNQSVDLNAGEVRTLQVQGFAPAVYGAGTRSFTVSLGGGGDGVALVGSPLTVTLPDTAAVPQVGFADGAALALTEGAGPTTVALHLSAPSAAPVTVQLDLQTGSGAGQAAPEDLQLSASEVTFPAGAVDTSVTLAAVADSDYEQDESAVLALGAVSGGQPGSPAQRSIAVAANGTPPVLALSGFPPEPVAEGAQIELQALLSGRSFQTVTAAVTATPGSAGAEDYTLGTGSISIPAGDTAASIALSIPTDDAEEAEESFAVALGTPENAVLDPDATGGTVAIQANGTPATASLTAASPAEITEGGGTASFALQLDHTTFRTVSAVLALSGTAGSGDLALQAGGQPVAFDGNLVTVTLAPGQASLPLSVQALADGLFEGTESAVLTLQSVDGAQASGDATAATLSLADADAAPTVSLQGGSTVTEGQPAQLQAVLSAAAAADTVIPWTLSQSHADFAAASGTVTVPAGQLSASFTLSANAGDSSYDDARDATVTLGAGSGFTLGSSVTQTVHVTDSAPVPTLAISAGPAAQVSEAAGTIHWTVALSHATGRTVTVPWTLSGTGSAAASIPADAGPASGTLTFAPGTGLTQDVAVTLVDDSVHEATEGLRLALGTPTNADAGTPATGDIAILDNDPLPTVAFTGAAPQQPVTEASGTATEFRVQLSNASSTSIAIPFVLSGTAASGSDYDATPGGGTLIVAAGDTSGVISVTPRTDSVSENDETVIVTLNAPDAAAATLTSVAEDRTRGLTIRDSTAAPVVSFTSTASPTLSEASATGVQLTVSISPTASVDVTVPFSLGGTATPNGDYTLDTASPLTIAAGTGSATIQLTAKSDIVFDPNESIVVSLGQPSRGSVSAVPGEATRTAVIADRNLNSCKQILAAAPGSASGSGYTITFNGIDGTLVTCDMTTDSGGWTVVYAASGAAGEPALLNSATRGGNPLAFQSYNASLAFKAQLAAVSSQTVVVRSGGGWLRYPDPTFNASVAGGGSNERIFATTVTTSSGTTASAGVGWSFQDSTNGGDFGIVRNQDNQTCFNNGSPHYGFDYHSWSSTPGHVGAPYKLLNCGCVGHYLYNYASDTSARAAGYDVNIGLAGWSAATNTCDSGSGGALPFYMALR